MDDKLALPLREGQNVRVFQRFTEGKRERNVPFVGVILKVRGSGVNKTITVREMLEGIAVEKIFPIALPTITKIEIVVEKELRKGATKKKSRKKAAAKR